MEAILKFNLPEESPEHQLAIKGADMYCALHALDQKLRSMLKYGHDYTDVDEALQYIRDTLHDEIDMGQFD